LGYYFEQYLKKSWFALIILFVPIFVALIIPSASSDFMLIVSAFVLSDLLANAIVTGGKGIAQIKTTGTTKTQPRGYVLVAFFFSILATSIIINLASQAFASFAIYLSSDWGLAFIIAGAIDLSVYGDMYMRFYLR
jgi:hypothetical protein